MLKRLLETFTSVTGSHRTDARLEAGRIARRCTLGFELSGDQSFRKLGVQALLTHQTVQDPNAVTDEQVATIINMLKAMAKELDYLETMSGLRERISEAYRREATPQ